MFKKYLILTVLMAMIVAPVFLPVLTSAQEVDLIPCTGAGGANPCDFDDLVELASNILTFLIFVSIPIATIAFAWAGVLMLTSQGKEEQIKMAKDIFWMVMIGFLFVLSAWLIVRLITSALLDENNYQDLLGADTSSHVATLKFDTIN